MPLPSTVLVQKDGSSGFSGSLHLLKMAEPTWRVGQVHFYTYNGAQQEVGLLFHSL